MMPNYSLTDPPMALYQNDTLTILVLKTNIADKPCLEKIASVLDREKRIRRWNVDQQDVDNVLRIECEQLTYEDIFHLVLKAGLWCEELPD
jgi:hypothetical protein